MGFVQRVWYRDNPVSRLLWPLSLLYGTVVRWRRRAYAAGWLTTIRAGVPVIVVGNINVGGSGKTPLVIWLIERLTAAGWRAGVVSRGYGGSYREAVLHVAPDTSAALAGDEPVLIARRTGRPVAVSRRRVEAARQLVRDAKVDIIVADDGLQHYALHRDLEIAVVAGHVGLGNRRLMPAGPLREPSGRLRQVDCVVVNGYGFTWPNGLVFHLVVERAYNLKNGEWRALTAFRGQPVHALAGTGYPQLFFDALVALGLRVSTHPFADHHRFNAADLHFEDEYPVLMTEKDAVKCQRFAAINYWAVPAEAVFDNGDESAFDAIMRCLTPDVAVCPATTRPGE